MTWRWWAVGALALCVLTVAGNYARPVVGPVPTQLQTLTAGRFTILREDAVRISGLGDAYRVTLYVPDTKTEAESDALDDAVFADSLGFLAEQYGFSTVVVSHAADKAMFRHRWWPFPIIAFGRNEHSAPKVFRRGSDGLWTRNGRGPDPVEYIEEYNRSTGVRFGLAAIAGDPPRGILIYDCLSCGTGTNIDDAVKGMHDLIQNVVLDEAEKEDLKDATVVIVTGRRQGQWRFPFVLRYRIFKKNGNWKGTSLDAGVWKKLAVGALQKSQSRGRAARASITDVVPLDNLHVTISVDLH